MIFWRDLARVDGQVWRARSLLPARTLPNVCNLVPAIALNIRREANARRLFSCQARNRRACRILHRRSPRSWRIFAVCGSLYRIRRVCALCRGWQAILVVGCGMTPSYSSATSNPSTRCIGSISRLRHDFQSFPIVVYAVVLQKRVANRSKSPAFPAESGLAACPRGYYDVDARAGGLCVLDFTRRRRYYNQYKCELQLSYCGAQT